MDFTVGQYVQLISALVLAMGVFLAVYFMPERILVSALILLLPFELIATRFGNINMVLIYFMGFSFLLKKKFKKFPLLGPLMILAFSYLLTLSQTKPSLYVGHFIYLINIGSNFVLFFIIYNYMSDQEKPSEFMNLLIILNILVLLFAVVQFSLGTGSHSFFGIGQIRVRGDKIMRAAEEIRMRGGPFMAVGINTEYLVIQILILGHVFLFTQEKWKKIVSPGLIVANFMIMVATGNRGGLISLVFGSVFFAMAYRKDIGTIRLIKIATAASISLTIAALIIVNYSHYSNVFQRLSDTELVDGMPDTRARVWEMAAEAIKNKPLLGHGPRMPDEKLAGSAGTLHTQADIHINISSPHNLYLFLLYTLGIVGLIAYAIFFVACFVKFYGAKKMKSGNKFIDGLPKLGMLILLVLLIDQMKVEFLRFNLVDYQNFLFMLLGGLFAFTDMVKRNSARSQSDLS